MIKKTGKGKYVVTSHSGKKLSKPLSKAGAISRLQQVEYYSNKGKGK